MQLGGLAGVTALTMGLDLGTRQKRKRKRAQQQWLDLMSKVGVPSAEIRPCALFIFVMELLAAERRAVPKIDECEDRGVH